MNAISTVLLMSLLFLSVPSAAQEGALDKASHDLAVSTVAGLMYVRGMSQKCPFDKKASETFEIVAMVVAAGIPKLPRDDIEAASKLAQTRLEKDIATAKEESCKKAIAGVQTTAEEIAAAIQKQKR